MAGKKTLFQRVLSKPGAKLASAAGSAPGKALPAFSVLYVYQRKDVDGSPWLRVGAATDGRSDGWLPAAQVSDWKQSLVLKFTERSGRAPVMFLRQSGEVEKLLADPAAAKSVLAKAQKNREDNGQILALEPTASAVPQNQFYLLPIFDSKESFDENGQPVQLLNVASIDPGSSAVAKPATAADQRQCRCLPHGGGAGGRTPPCRCSRISTRSVMWSTSCKPVSPNAASWTASASAWWVFAAASRKPRAWNTWPRP